MDTELLKNPSCPSLLNDIYPQITDKENAFDRINIFVLKRKRVMNLILKETIV